MENPLIVLSNELAAVAEQAGRRVVAVHGRPRISSSGVLWRSGVVVTAEHTLRRGEDVRVTLPDGDTVQAELAGRDPGTDLAVLKVAPSPIAGDTAQPDSLKSGHLVLVVGRSEEKGISAAMGVISNVSGPWHTWRGGRIDRLLRLDVGLYPGASGGAVVDVAGNLIGIATAGLSRTSVFGIPASTVNLVADQLLDRGHVKRGYLGVALQPIALPEHLRVKPDWGERKGGLGGLIVLSVEPDGPAGRAGIVIGDVLIGFERKPVLDTDDVQAFLSMEYVGKPVKASVMRGGKLTELVIQIGERPRREA